MSKYRGVYGHNQLQVASGIWQGGIWQDCLLRHDRDHEHFWRDTVYRT